MMASRDEVMAALAGVPGPDGRTPLPESGAISGLTIRDGKVFLAILIDPAKAQAMEAMGAKVEAAIKALPGITNAVVTQTAEAARAAVSASPGNAHEERGQQRRSGRSSEPLPGVKQL